MRDDEMNQAKVLVAVEVGVGLLIFLSLFFERDLGFIGFTNTLFVRPFLIVTFLVLITIHGTRLTRRQDSVSKKVLNAIYLLGLILLLLLFHVFARQIAFAREIAYFGANRACFEQTANLAPHLLGCATSGDYGCSEFLSLPASTCGAGKHVRAFTYKGELALFLDIRPYVKFVYLEDSTHFLQVSTGIDISSCDYMLSQDWYLC
jgi:hypothetical protein